MIISSYQQKPVIEEEIKRLYSEYNDLITKKEKLTKELNDKNKDFAIIEHYTEEIYNLKKIIDEYERQKRMRNYLINYNKINHLILVN